MSFGNGRVGGAGREGTNSDLPRSSVNRWAKGDINDLLSELEADGKEYDITYDSGKDSGMGPHFMIRSGGAIWFVYL